MIPDTDCFRLVDRPDHTVDRFGPVAILSTYAPHTPAQELAIARGLKDVTTVYVKRRPAKAQGAEGVSPPEPILGPALDTLVATEHGLKFEIRPANGLSVGLYLDARDARAWVRAHAQGRTVLNLFAYTCGFGVAALKGQAARAVNVDLSRKVLDWGETNAALNGFTPDRRDFIAGDCFDWLARFQKKGERFDLVVLDPPSFSTFGKGKPGKSKRFRAEKDYPALAAAARAVVAQGGILVACCNLETLSARDFARLVGPTGKTIATFGASPEDFAQPSALKVICSQL